MRTVADKRIISRRRLAVFLVVLSNWVLRKARMQSLAISRIANKKIYCPLFPFVVLLLGLPSFGWANVQPCSNAEGPATLNFIPGNQQQCDGIDECRKRDAIVFVHGIYGGPSTWVNEKANPHFDWTQALHRTLNRSDGSVMSQIDVQSGRHFGAVNCWSWPQAATQTRNAAAEAGRRLRYTASRFRCSK